MLREIEFKNFLPFHNQKVVFPLNSTIAIVGKNGRGKSSMLEGILFVLYGEGRMDLKGLKRIESDDSEGMYVKLIYQLNNTQEITIKRGLRPAGSGYTQVWLGKELVAKGGASPVNNPAQDFINASLGIDSDTFKLTAFFGLGVNDTLMQVRPSERLETLQKVAGIDVCIKFQKKANDKANELSKWVEKEERGLEVMSDNLEDEDELQSDVTSKTEKLEEQKEVLDTYAIERRSLLTEEDRFQGLLREKEGLSKKRTVLIKQKENFDRRVQNARENYNTAKMESKETIEERTALLEKIQGMKSVEYIDSQLTELKTISAKDSVSVELIETALSVADSSCPLCGAKLTEFAVSEWKKDLEVLQVKQQKRKDEIGELNQQLRNREKAEKQLQRVKSDLKNIIEEGERAKDTGKEAQTQVRVFTADIVKTDNRMVKIEAELKGYEKILSRMEVLDEEALVIRETVGSLTESIKNIRIRITGVKEAKKAIKKTRSTILEKKSDALGYSWVANAFARHAIPVQLLENLRNVLQRRATRIYQQFSSGSVMIVDTPGARPGLEFVLRDGAGQRAYKALSSGEKVMFFLAVRVALSQVINAGKNNKVDFLVLDEIAGNLDPDNRENLTRLINALLKKFFPQILLVSHVEMRDIFNKTLTVTKKNGVSRIQ